MSLIPNIRTLGNIFDPSTINVLDPFHLLPAQIRESTSRENLPLSDIRIDWKETPQAHFFQADLPGMTKEQVQLEVEDGRVLKISGERKIVKEENGETWHKIERIGGKFLRQFRLPENAKIDQISASMKNGVLTVTVPKEEGKRPEVKPIQISG